MTDLHRPVPAEEARQVRCPKCAAGPKSLCRRVYRNIPGASPESLARTNARAGETFEQVHEERRRAAQRTRLRALDLQALTGGPPPRDQAVLRAVQDFDRREHDQLRGWLAQNVGLLLGSA